MCVCVCVCKVLTLFISFLLLLQKTPKKKRKEPLCPASSAGEAIERMLVEKKISSKINYDVLRDLDKVWEQSDTIMDSSSIKVQQDLSSEPESQLPISTNSPQTCFSSPQTITCSPQGSMSLTITRGPLSNRLPSLLSRKRPLSPSLLTTGTESSRYVHSLSWICHHRYYSSGNFNVQWILGYPNPCGQERLKICSDK